MIDRGAYASLPRAMRAAEEGPVGLDAVPDNPTAAMVADRRQLVDGALEAVEDVSVTGRDNFECQVIVVATHFALGHGWPRDLEMEERRCKARARGLGGRSSARLCGNWRPSCVFGLTRAATDGMTMREFEDQSGRTCRVWDTVPERTVGLAPEYQMGWLTFDIGSERRRLAPIPPNWADLPPERLMQRLRLAPMAHARAARLTRLEDERRRAERRQSERRRLAERRIRDRRGALATRR
jgi:hypothetical protein